MKRLDIIECKFYHRLSKVDREFYTVILDQGGLHNSLLIKMSKLNDDGEILKSY